MGALEGIHYDPLETREPEQRDAELLAALPVEEAGLLVLRWVAGQDGSVMRRNFVIGIGGSHGAPEGVAARRPAAEAWHWLEARGLIFADYDGDAWWPSRLGLEVLAAGDGGRALVQARELLGHALHRRLEPQVRRLFSIGEFESAAFRAMREVEIVVREESGLQGMSGVPLMRRAFDASEGHLRSPSHDDGERQRLADLYAGAIGTFKNPSSHRAVEFDDPVEASEVVLFADLLLRIVDRIAVPARREREARAAQTLQ